VTEFSLRYEDGRPLDHADADMLRACHLYMVAMTLVTGRAPYPDLLRPFGVDREVCGAIEFYNLLLPQPSASPPDEEEAIWQALIRPAVARLEEEFDGPRKPLKRRARSYGPQQMRLDDPHYIAAWLIEQLRRYWCHHYGEPRCPRDELDVLIARVMAMTRRCHIELDRERLRSVLRDPKSRRLTNIFYRVF